MSHLRQLEKLLKTNIDVIFCEVNYAREKKSIFSIFKSENGVLAWIGRV